MIKQITHRNYWLPVLVLCILAAIGAGTCLFLRKGAPAVKEEGPPTAEEWEELKKEHPYIDDVMYTGPFDDMTVYDYPFRKTDSYVCNKDFKPDKAQVINTVTDFTENVMSVNYSTIVADTGGYVEKVKAYMPYCMVYYDAGYYVMDDPMTGDQFIEGLSDYLVKNEAAASTEFLTNESLVYSDGTTWCRGILKTTVHMGSGENLTTEDMVDVELIYGDGGYKVIGIYLAKNFSDKLPEGKEA